MKRKIDKKLLNQTITIVIILFGILSYVSVTQTINNIKEFIESISVNTKEIKEK